MGSQTCFSAEGGWGGWGRDVRPGMETVSFFASPACKPEALSQACSRAGTKDIVRATEGRGWPFCPHESPSSVQ